MRAVHILHLTHSYDIPTNTEQEIYQITLGFSGYLDFIRYIKKNRYEIIHIHSVAKETFGIYAFFAKLYGARVVLSMHNPTVFSYGYILKRLCARFLISHTICTSRYDVRMIDTYHIARKSRRLIVYQGFAEQYKEDMFSKESARSHLYRKMGISFTKNIRIVGTIVADDDKNGIEHLIDAAYLADTYKNLTNTIFVILVRETISESVRTQIHEMKVDGICFIVEHVENPEEYMRAFDIYVSPRVHVGDLYVLITALYMHISCIATKVGDTEELDAYVGAPLVPVRSAKYLTEALMYVIARSKEIVTKIGARPVMLPKKFTEEAERTAINNIYERILKK
jgi:Glycosyltransferase Family 4